MKTTLDVVPTPLIERDNVTGIDRMSITYTQFDDTNHATDRFDMQTLTVETEEGGCISENEAREQSGFYFVLKTDRWAIDPDNLDAITDLLKDFRDRLMFGVRKEPIDYGYKNQKRQLKGDE